MISRNSQTLLLRNLVRPLCRPLLRAALRSSTSMSSGGSSPGYTLPAPLSVAIAAGALITSVQLGNPSTAAETNPAVSWVQGFQRGNVPLASTQGRTLVLGDGAGGTTPLQQDAETYYNDGSLKTAVLTAVPPSVPASTTTTAPPRPLSWSAALPNRTPFITLAQLASATNFRVELTGYDLGTDVFELAVNDVIAGGSTFPWGTNPVQGFRVVAAGPLKCSWMFWAFVKRASDGARHKWIKAKLWVDAYPGGQFSVIAKITQPNIFGPHPSGTVGANPQPKHVFTAKIVNGSTTICTVGGAFDPRTQTLPGTAFDPTTQIVAGLTAPPMACVALTGPGLPTGCQSNTPFFVGYKVYTNIARLYVSRYATIYAPYPTYASLQSGAGRSGAGYAGAPDYVSTSNGASYTNAVADISNPPQQALRAAEPTGTSSTDGAVTWTCISAGPFTAQNSGSVTVAPLIALYPGSSVTLCDLSNGERVWVGRSRPRIYAAPEISYYTQKTFLTPPYDQTVAINQLSKPSVPIWPSALMFIGPDLNQTGDSTGDERISPINHSAVCAILRPFDEIQRQDAIAKSHSWEDYRFFYEDERTGIPPIANAGPGKDGIAYSNTVLATELAITPLQSAGVAVPDLHFTNQNGYQDRYGTTVDGSHLPICGYGPYLQTGDDSFLEQIVLENATVLVSAPVYSPCVVGSTTYYCCNAVNPGDSGRQAAWWLRLLGNAYALTPPDRPYAAYIKDVYNDNAAYLDAKWQTLPAAQISYGDYHLDLSVNYTQMWMEDFFSMMVCQEILRGDTPHFAHFFGSFFYRFTVDCCDTSVGGKPSQAANRDIINFPTGAAQTIANLYTGWTQAFAALADLPTIAWEGPGGPEVYQPSSLPQFKLNTLIYATMAGLPKARALHDDYYSRMVAYTHGYFPTQTLEQQWVGYPEFSFRLPGT